MYNKLLSTTDFLQFKTKMKRNAIRPVLCFGQITNKKVALKHGNISKY